MHITSVVKEYVILVVYKSNISNSTLVVSKYNDIIPSKFKTIHDRVSVSTMTLYL